jgi:hypothetical protein
MIGSIIPRSSRIILAPMASRGKAGQRKSWNCPECALMSGIGAIDITKKQP